MGIEGLPTQLMQIPFGVGVNQRGDKRAQNQPTLDIAKDVQFDEVGGLQTRHPFVTTGLNIAGGGTIVAADVRRIEPDGDGFLLFTKDHLYTWDSLASVWRNRGEHLATTMDEETVFAQDDYQAGIDRAELNGVEVYAWTRSSGAGGGCLAAARTTSGTVLMSPTVIADAVTRVRLVALQTKILLFFENADPSLKFYVIDPADVAGSLAGSIGPGELTALASPNFNHLYDVAAIPGADVALFVARRITTTSYTVAIVSSAGSVHAFTKARTADGPVAIAVSSGGTAAQVVRANGTNIQGDLLIVDLNFNTLNDVFTGQAIGTVTAAVTLIAAAFRSAQNAGQFRCYAFWGEQVTGGTHVKSNWVDTGGSLGTQNRLIAWHDIASRAFDRAGHVYCWTIFDTADPYLSEQFQNVYVLVRDDGFVAATSRVGNAGPNSFGILPGVQATTNSDEYAWSGAFVLPSDANNGDTTASPRKITIAFDRNEARRCARLGATLYIAGAPVMQYDGAQLTELGFFVGPWYMVASDAGAGLLDAGTYAHKPTLRFTNARNEIDRSTSFVVTNITIAASHKIQFTGTGLPHACWATRKSGAAFEVWRTLHNPIADSPFFLVSSRSAVGSGGGGYLQNSTFFDTASPTIAAFTDNLADASAGDRPQYPTGLEVIPPPPARIIMATDTRLFLAGIAGSPDQVWYSRQRGDGETAGFNDGLVFEVPHDGGKITALAVIEGEVVVFRESATYAFPGDGFDNTGGGANYGPPRIVALDLGAISMEGVCVGDDGIYVKTLRGWHLLDKALTYHYIGASTFSSDSESVLAMQIMRTQQQVRILTTGRMLLFDMVTAQWDEWTIADGVHATLWNNTHVYLSDVSGPMLQRADFTGVNYGLDVESAWIKFNDLQGRALVRMISLLGEIRAACSLRVRLARNYESDGAGGWNYNYDKTWLVTPTTAGAPLQLEVFPKFKRCQTIKIRITALGPDKVSAPTGDTVKLTGLALAFALEEEMFQGVPAAQRQ